jgi:hypothetical protein
VSWDQRFFDPIMLPGRKPLVTLHDAAQDMWNPDFHGDGHPALNIQGQAELLPVKPGETLSRI